MLLTFTCIYKMLSCVLEKKVLDKPETILDASHSSYLGPIFFIFIQFSGKCTLFIVGIPTGIFWIRPFKPNPYSDQEICIFSISIHNFLISIFQWIVCLGGLDIMAQYLLIDDYNPKVLNGHLVQTGGSVWSEVTGLVCMLIILENEMNCTFSFLTKMK